MYNLFLDDFRVPKDAFNYTRRDTYLKSEWTTVRSYMEFVNYITANGLPKLISFDHDLADAHYEEYHKTKGAGFDYDSMTEKTGYHCAKWLIEYCMDNKLKCPAFLVHSMNPAGGKNIQMLLENFIKHEG